MSIRALVVALAFTGAALQALAAEVPPVPPPPAPLPAGATLSEAEAVRRGEAVVEHWDKCDYGFVDMKADYKLILRNAEGQEATRLMSLRMLELDDHDGDGIKTTGDWSIVAFRHPPDVNGTALLVHANLDKNDDTWIYLPSLKRIKRISSENQSGNFAGTEFSYEDIASQEYRKFRYKWLRDEACGTANEPGSCAVVEQYPTYPNSGYSRQIAWYDGCRQRRIDYYDLKGSLAKTQTFNDYRQYHGKHWRGHDNTMINHQNGKSTHLVIDKFEYRSGFTREMFAPESLSKLFQ